MQGWRPASIISGAPPSGFLGEFRSYYGPTMNAFAAAEGSDRADKLQAELEALFDSQKHEREPGRHPHSGELPACDRRSRMRCREDTRPLRDIDATNAGIVEAALQFA